MKTPLVGSHIGLVSDVSADGVTYIDTGGDYGGGSLTLTQILQMWAAGSSTVYMTKKFGGQEDKHDLGALGAAPTVDLANGNVFLGQLDQDCSFSFTGWPASTSATIRLTIAEDGTGGWTPSFPTVTWIGGTPSWDTTALSTMHAVLFSDDAGVTIWGGVLGGVIAEDRSLKTVPSSGSSELIDVAAFRHYDITLDDDCTLSLSGGVSGQVWGVELILRQGGTGSYTITFPGSVDWQDPVTGLGGGSPPVLFTAVGAQNVIDLVTLDGGTTWGGSDQSSSGGSSFTAGGDLTGTSTSQTVVAINGSPIGTLTPAIGDRLRWNGTAWVDSGLIWRPVTVFDPTSGLWVPLVDGSGNAIMAEA